MSSIEQLTVATAGGAALGIDEDDTGLPMAAVVSELGRDLAAALFGNRLIGSSSESRRRVVPFLIVGFSLALHVFLAATLARLPADAPSAWRPRSHVRVTVTRPPEPVKPKELPPPPIELPKRVPPPPPIVKKKVAVLPKPEPVPLEAPPPPAEPVLAKTEATEPGAVIGSAEGSVDGTGVVGGVKGGTGEVLAPPPPPPPIVQAHEGAGYLKNPRPPYPELAQRRGWEGEVLLRVRVNPAGRVEGAVVRRSSGREVLDEAALAAVRSWTFVPAHQGSTAIAGSVDVPIVFKLQ
jgi:protein TonB